MSHPQRTPMTLVVLWRDGGESSFETNLETVEDAISMYRRADFQGLSSDPGERAFVLATSQDEVRGLAAYPLEDSEVHVGVELIRRCETELRTLRESAAEHGVEDLSLLLDALLSCCGT